MEDYKEKYEQALERAKICYKDLSNLDGVVATMSKDFFEEVFPELKESEDERIRKEMIDFMSSQLKSLMPPCPSNETLKTWSAWLEKQGKQKTAWSEEDKEKIELLIAIFEVNHPNEYFKVNPINTLNMEAMSTEEIVDWLKSLKERYTWKPSDEQIKQLGWIAEQNKDNMIGKELMSLYQDLKKLREE